MELHKSFDFFSITFQPLQLMRYYDGDVMFTLESSNTLLINQKVTINGEQTYITNMKTIQIDEKIFKLLKDEIYVGRKFDQEDLNYEYKNNIPVILDYNYFEYYSMRDIIEFNFLKENLNFGNCFFK